MDKKRRSKTATARKRQAQEQQETEGKKGKQVKEEKEEAETTKIRSECSHKTQETDEEMQTGEEEKGRYRNHVPGELERLLGEFMDAYEITEALIGQGE